jgi:hypothetical protein
VNTVKLDLTGLRTLQRQVAELPAHKVQVGLFEDTAGRVADPGRIDNNPSLGAVHEFGLGFSILKTHAEVWIPERSFLRMPLQLHLGPALMAAGKGLFKVLREQGVKRFLGLIGATAEDVVQEAFATGGWGVWPKLAPSTIAAKHSAAILIESAQMRKAVSSRVI